MVRADNEHTSTNGEEENTSTQKNFVEKLKFCDRDKKDADEPARLKTLPKYLMHWLTPAWIAATGFFIALAFAVIWRGEFHWPSAEAMKLCATIAGAGFAFSAWQQRSHDNVVNAKQAQATAEREDYWKRREHIYQLLGSKNPGLRLSAVALLAELADMAAESNLLSTTEKQQLQRHIINTLCTQVRHEGLCNASEGSEEEHAGIQKSIMEIIFRRIHIIQNHSPLANWTKELIDLTDSKILTPIHWKNITTDAVFNFRGTIFSRSVIIRDSKIKWIQWDTSHFTETLIIKSENRQTIIGTNTLPTKAKKAQFTKVTFELPKTLDRFKINMHPIPGEYHILVDNCRFTHRRCPCVNKTKCTCINPLSITPLIIQFFKMDKTLSSYAKHGVLQVTNCQTQDITLESQSTEPQILLQNNIINGQLKIILGANDTPRRADSIRYLISGHLKVKNNKISTNDTHHPINLFTFPNDDFSRFLTFDNNTTFTPSHPHYQYPLHITKVDEASCSYHFEYSIPQSSENAHIVSWTDGDQTTK